MARRSFDEVYQRLEAVGPATVVSSRGTEYVVKARFSRRGRVIEAFPGGGRVTMHEDCWGDDTTCQGTRAGGIYNGDPSIYDWYDRSR